MTPWRLRFREGTTLPVDATALRPEMCAGKTAGELERLPVQVGNRQLPLGELATVTAGDADTLLIEGAFAALDGLGHGMASGRLEIHGDVGAYLGQGMRGGRIELFGSAGPFAAAGLSGGTIHIHADAGDCLGAALPGERHGMRGGTVVVGGRAGDRVGDRMRRGLVVVQGDAGSFAAARMIGGTILIAGRCGPEIGYGMRRGSLVLAHEPAHLPVTFAENGVHELPWLGLLDRLLAGLDPPQRLPGRRAARWTGDAATAGKGEILIAA